MAISMAKFLLSLNTHVSTVKAKTRKLSHCKSEIFFVAKWRSFASWESLRKDVCPSELGKLWKLPPKRGGGGRCWNPLQAIGKACLECCIGWLLAFDTFILYAGDLDATDAGKVSM